MSPSDSNVSLLNTNGDFISFSRPSSINTTTTTIISSTKLTNLLNFVKIYHTMSEKDTLLTAVSEKLQYMGRALSNPHQFSIERGKCYAVIGENGSGKTTLAKIIEKGWNICTNVIRGDKKSLSIKNIEFSDIHSITGNNVSYYQQRFEATHNDDIPTVEEIIADRIPADRWNDMCQRLSLTDIMHKRINYLSSGELRKFLIINLFTEIPDILIIDNPYIGLDAPSRDLLNELLASIVNDGTAVILLLCNPTDIPQLCNYVLPLKDMTIGKMRSTSDCDSNFYSKLFPAKGNFDNLPIATECNTVDFDTAIELNDCNVSYGNTIILHNVQWTVKAAEKWALLGANGSGKSTLLSLVYADNPQSYRNSFSLFDHKRGTGESIWDIKRRIGYISPEMHLYFNDAADMITVVASGFFDNVGCFRRPNDEQKAIAMQWLKGFGIEHLASRRFPTLSSGEQRLALIARTLLKNAPLLILDEPLHGLDITTKALVTQAIEFIANRQGQTLIYVTHYDNEIPTCVTQIKRLKREQ